ncbi:MAG: FMN-binding protein [Tissierellia bacterium]|nr:FMN-binding protein [Tissierellia bacterium]
MKVFKRFLIIFIVLILICGLAFILASNKIVKDARGLKVKKLDELNLEDGTHYGSYKLDPVSVSLETRVEDRKIKEIKIIEHINGMGTKGEDVIKAIIDQQSLDVVAVSGATVSSIAIIKAGEDSLDN